MKVDGTLFTLENDELLVAVARHEAELTRAFDKKAGRDISWGVGPTVWDRHVPVLSPFVGRCYEDRYVYEEKEYQMPTQHGFIRDMGLEPVLCDLDKYWFKLKDTPEAFEKYPFHLELEVGHRLEGRTITVMWKVTNPDSGEVLFIMGEYPTFQVPEEYSICDYTFEFNREGYRKGQFQEELHYLAPTSGGYESEKLVGILSLRNGRVKLTEEFFDTALAYMFDDAQVSSVNLLLDGGSYMIMGHDDFPYLGVWTIEDTHPFACLGP